MVLFVVLWCGGLIILSLLHPLFHLSVFNTASVFNQDVSTWNTGAVTSMYGSKCKISLLFVLPPPPYLCIPSSISLTTRLIYMYTPSAVGYFNITTTRVLFVHNSHTFCYVVCGGLAGWSFFSLWHPLFSLLQCFIKHICSIRTCPHGIRGW